MDDDSPRAGTLLERLHRLATIQILGIRDLYKPGHHPRHRPRTIDAAVKAHDIAQFVEYYRALHPDDRKRTLSRLPQIATAWSELTFIRHDAKSIPSDDKS